MKNHLLTTTLGLLLWKPYKILYLTRKLLVKDHTKISHANLYSFWPAHFTTSTSGGLFVMYYYPHIVFSKVLRTSYGWLCFSFKFRQIVVLEDGRVVEQGPHDVLLSKAGRYAQLWARQNTTIDWLHIEIKKYTVNRIIFSKRIIVSL